MKNLKIKRISRGYHHIMNGNKRVGTIERSEGGPTPAAGNGLQHTTPQVPTSWLISGTGTDKQQHMGAP